MSMSENINIFWADLMVEELVRNGITFFIISPGSRSTPLTVAAVRNPHCQTEISIDERGAAFYALGYVKASGQPAVLICTSGTATANYFPAIIEAAMTDVPLIILTADRPPELLETGANQTIRQDNLYGDYLRWHSTLPCPDDKIAPEYIL
ncbi:MAG: 2-succinyl-5-enolpyruvyl-6-hydroxy-3-cyclohexene-1-carboxylate synthase, partial [Calditrichaeota bacterium]